MAEDIDFLGILVMQQLENQTVMADTQCYYGMTTLPSIFMAKNSSLLIKESPQYDWGPFLK